MSQPFKATLMDSAGERAHWRPAGMIEQIRDSIRSCLLTRRGEREFCPHLGSSLHLFAFRPMSHSLRTDLKNHIKEVLKRGEPRIRVSEVDVRSELTQDGVLDLVVHYEVLGSGKTGEVRVRFDA